MLFNQKPGGSFFEIYLYTLSLTKAIVFFVYALSYVSALLNLTASSVIWGLCYNHSFFSQFQNVN